jgi:hypothetical protein
MDFFVETVEFIIVVLIVFSGNFWSVHLTFDIMNLIPVFFNFSVDVSDSLMGSLTFSGSVLGSSGLGVELSLKGLLSGSFSSSLLVISLLFLLHFEHVSESINITLKIISRDSSSLDLSIKSVEFLLVSLWNLSLACCIGHLKFALFSLECFEF